MIGHLTDAVLTLAGTQLLLLAGIVLTQKRGTPLQRRLFAAFLLAKAFLMLRWFCYRFGLFSFERHLTLHLASGAGFFLLAPFLYLYIRALCYRDLQLRPRHLIHLLPFAVWVAGSLVPRSVPHYWDLFWGMNLVQILLYIIAMLRTVHTYRTQLRQSYSTVEGLDLGWLTALLGVIVLHWLFVVSRGSLSILNLGSPGLLAVLDLLAITIFLAFTTTLVIMGVRQLKLFTGIDEMPKYANSKLPEFDVQGRAEALTRHMKKEKPYLTPSLTIDDLSTRLSMPSWQLSQVINRSFKQNFFNFINAYRVEEAKRHLVDPAGKKKTVLEILYEVGFNSKSTFNEAFRRHTGMTPRDFRKMHRN